MRHQQFLYGLSNDKGIGSATVLPMPVVAVSVRFTVVWPIGRPAAENGKLPCHWPGPILCSDVIGSKALGPNVSFATLVLVIAEIVMGSPFLTTEGAT
jgi:hypothetical protein